MGSSYSAKPLGTDAVGVMWSVSRRLTKDCDRRALVRRPVEGVAAQENASNESRPSWDTLLGDSESEEEFNDEGLALDNSVEVPKLFEDETGRLWVEVQNATRMWRTLLPAPHDHC